LPEGSLLLGALHELLVVLANHVIDGAPVGAPLGSLQRMLLLEVGMGACFLGFGGHCWLEVVVGVGALLVASQLGLTLVWGEGLGGEASTVLALQEGALIGRTISYQVAADACPGDRVVPIGIQLFALHLLW
jgi:hypothetical protein